MATQKSFDAIFNDAILYIQNNCDYADFLRPALISSKAVIQVEYGTINKFVKDNFMQAKDEPLDRHKCAAAFMIAILKNLKIENIEQKPNVSKLIREKIAIDVGLSILITMIKEKANDIENIAIIKYWNGNKNHIDFPPLLCHPKTERYEESWALGLYYARKEDKLFVLSLANDLFLIESYNRKIVSP